MEDNETNKMKTFEELGVEPELLRTIKEMGFDTPMPIQKW